MIAPLAVFLSQSPTTHLAPFRFLEPGSMLDEEVTLELLDTVPATPGRAPTYRFKIVRRVDGTQVGSIELRIGNSDDIILYTGHIGYRVEAAFRGQRYAARACRVLFALARRHGFAELWVTCDPDNAASYRTCVLIGGEHVETVPVPKAHGYYAVGSHAKCRFRVRLPDAEKPAPKGKPRRL